MEIQAACSEKSLVAGCKRLVHFSIKTRLVYLDRKEQLVNIVRPIDDLWKKGGIEWQGGLLQRQSKKPVL